MALPDKWKNPPIQASKEEKKQSLEELAAKLLASGLARSSMEAKQMASSMIHVDKTQKDFEAEIKKVHEAPRVKKPNSAAQNEAQEIIETVSDSVDGVYPSSGSQSLLDGVSKAHTLLVSEVATLREHVAKQQLIIERLEQDVTFIRSQLQNKASESSVSYPRTPTAAELLDSQEKVRQEHKAKVAAKVENVDDLIANATGTDENDDEFIK